MQNPSIHEPRPSVTVMFYHEANPNFELYPTKFCAKNSASDFLTASDGKIARGSFDTLLCKALAYPVVLVHPSGLL